MTDDVIKEDLKVLAFFKRGLERKSLIKPGNIVTRDKDLKTVIVKHLDSNCINFSGYDSFGLLDMYDLDNFHFSTPEVISEFFTKLESNGFIWNEYLNKIINVNPFIKKGKWYLCIKSYKHYGSSAYSFIKGRFYKASSNDVLIAEGRGKVKFIGGAASEHFKPAKEENYDNWTLKDAKVGEVISDDRGNIGIFQGLGHADDGGSHNDDSYCFLYCIVDSDDVFYPGWEHNCIISSYDNPKPANNSEIINFFKIMKMYGFSWDRDSLKLIDEIKR